MLLTAVLVGVLLFTFTSAKVEFSPLALESLPAASPPAEMSISALPTGSMESTAFFAYRGGGFNDKREFTMTAYLVSHPKGDLLFDAGFGRNVDEHVAVAMPSLMRSLTTYKKGTSAAEQLRANGDALEKLAGVVLTHSHWDHVSGLDALPGVPVWVNNAETAFIAQKSPMTELIRSFLPVNYKQYEFKSSPYLGFPESHDFWGDGSVVIVPSPGHTPGSIVAFVNLPSGKRFALLGDLVWQVEGVTIPAERPWLSRRIVRENDDQVRENIARVAAIHQRFPEIHMIPAHDDRPAAIPVYPASFQ
ncbi:MAG TPA: MBL fold metallo-hydrolase [Pyrinomonadaceae bacterium]|nr:MBL fold metallo-hydrolase [Pyrinomonadaceae bacterium]